MSQIKKSRLQSDFKIKGLLGSGSYGAVLQVENILDKQSYAIKISPYDGGHAMREVENLVKVPSHPNVVHYFTCWKDVFQKSELTDISQSLNTLSDKFNVGAWKSEVVLLCIQMELCKEDLRKWMGRQENVDESQVRNIFIQIAKGLQHIHNHNIIHRDLKPENIFLSTTTVSSVVKIGDLGIATAHHSTHSAAHTVSMGTPLYLAPEQGSPRYGKPADLYALGLILFELFSPQLQPRKCGGSFGKLYESFVDLKYKGVMPSEVELKWPKEAALILNLLQVEPEKRPGFQAMYDIFQSPISPPQKTLEEKLTKLSLKQDKVESPKFNQWGNQVVGQTHKLETEKNMMTIATQKVTNVQVSNCVSCRKPVNGLHAVVGGDPWHTECFKCHHCLKVMENHFLQDGKFYCPDDYYKLFSPRCAHCKEPIRDKYTKAIGKIFHPEHFNCFTCGLNLHQKRHFRQNDNAYCEDDYHKQFSPRCASCNEPCKGDSYWKAMDKTWHPEHFNCSICGVNLHKVPFYSSNGRPFCTKCKDRK